MLKFHTVLNTCDECNNKFPTVDLFNKYQKTFLALLQESSNVCGVFGHFSIHHEMVSDSAQTEAYRNAIYNNLHQMKDTNGLDLGCGTGSFSMFCQISDWSGHV